MGLAASFSTSRTAGPWVGDVAWLGSARLRQQRREEELPPCPAEAGTMGLLRYRRRTVPLFVTWPVPGSMRVDAGTNADARGWTRGVRGTLCALLVVGICSGVRAEAAGSTPVPSRRLSTYFARTSTLSVKLVVSGHDVIGVGSRGSVVCDDGTRHWQLFTEGLPTDHGPTIVDQAGNFHYRQFDPFRPGLPESFEAMRARIVQGGIHGRVRLWERAPLGEGGRFCGTRSSRGGWTEFFARQIRPR
jgi:hypothetical protein